MADTIINQPDKLRAQQREATRRYRLKNRNSPEYKAQRSRIAMKRYYRLKAEGKCVFCDNPHSPNSVFCTSHRQYVKEVKAERKSDLRKRGLCTLCGKRTFLPATKDRRESFCEPCFCKKTSTDCLGTARYGPILGERLRQQNYRCAYTGELIVLGLNDSLDHLFPISRFPELKSDPANTQWVTRKANHMKGDSTHEEFLDLMKLIISRF